MQASTSDPLIVLNSSRTHCPGKAGLWAAGTLPERSPAASRTWAQGKPRSLTPGDSPPLRFLPGRGTSEQGKRWLRSLEVPTGAHKQQLCGLW